MEGRWEGACVVTKKAERSASLWARQFHQALSPQTQSQGKAVEDRINNWDRVKLAKRLEHHAIKYVVITARSTLFTWHSSPCILSEMDSCPWNKHITKVDLVKCLIHLEHPYALKSRKTFRKSWFVFGQIHQTPHYTPLTDFKQASCAPTFSKSEVINCTWASHSPRRTIGITQKKGISPSPPTQKLSLCLWYVSHMVQQAANWRRCDI